MNCPLCESGFPLVGNVHVGNQSKGMIPTTLCRKHIERGDIKMFWDKLNSEHASVNYRNGRYHQKKRPYGDYLYAQDYDKFIMEMCSFLGNLREGKAVQS